MQTMLLGRNSVRCAHVEPWEWEEALRRWSSTNSNSARSRTARGPVSRRPDPEPWPEQRLPVLCTRCRRPRREPRPKTRLPPRRGSRCGGAEHRRGHRLRRHRLRRHRDGGPDADVAGLPTFTATDCRTWWRRRAPGFAVLDGALWVRCCLPFVGCGCGIRWRRWCCRTPFPGRGCRRRRARLRVLVL